jgi:hypothetical protein
VHAQSGFADVTREFELALTELMGAAAAKAMSVSSSNPRSLINTVFGR